MTGPEIWPTSLEDYFEDLERTRTLALRRLEHTHSAMGPMMGVLVQALEVSRQGGKRLRARLLWEAWRAHGGQSALGSLSQHRLATLGASVEMFQDAALVHDDIIDQSDMRRGHSALHKALQTLHREKNWSGDSEHVGMSLALIVGDLILLASETAFQSALRGAPAEIADFMASLHRVSRRDVMVGQFMDALGPHLPMPDDPEQLYEEALAVVRSKSAMYSVAAPLTIGAAAAGAGEAESNVMMKFGMPLGEAFQLRDDQLAITGDPNVTGKGGGGDLADGKRTVLIAMTLRRLPDEEAKPFLRALSRGGKPPVRERVEHLREIIIGSGALDDLEAAIQRRVDRALQALEQSDMRPSGKQIMRDVAHMLVDRQA